MIEFKNVSKTFPNGTKALKDFNLSIDQGEFVFILGASGAGKSTFLRLIMREEVASQGEVTVNGINLNTIKAKKIPYYRRHLGIVFQDFRLIPKMKVYDNVAFAQRCIGAKEKDVSRRVSYALSLVGLSSKTKSLPNELSGGEQQRVALARALVNDADIIIADEPTGNIDPAMSLEIVGLLDRINKEKGTTVIMVTHEHELIKHFNNRVVEIKNGTVVKDTKHPEIKDMTPDYSPDHASTKIMGYYDDAANSDYYSEFLDEYNNAKDGNRATNVVKFTPTEAKDDSIADEISKSLASDLGTPDAPDYSKYMDNNGKDGAQ